VEQPAQLRFLSDHGCDAMQGYYFSRPLPADKFIQLLRDDAAVARRISIHTGS
jgi:EAL domain-containing protein (putative c-di-GMP-specific phosphodiesterase class I)